MKKILKTAAVALTGLFCSAGLFAENGSLVKFNVADPEMTWDGTDYITDFGNTNTENCTTYGPALLFNHKVDFENDEITVEAIVNYSSTSGHNGVGLLKTNGPKPAGYTMVTAQNIKNTGGKGGGNGFEPAIDWTALTGKDLKFIYTFSGTAKGDQQTFTVYDGETKKGYYDLLKATSNFDPTDIVYPTVGGTNTANMKWKNVKVTVNGTEYTINSLAPQSALPELTTESILVRGEEGESQLTYTCKAPGGTDTTLNYEIADPSIIEITDTTQTDTEGNRIIKYNAKNVGTTTIKFTNSSAEYLAVTVTFVITRFPASNTISNLPVYPEIGSTTAYTDGELVITFDEAPVKALGGSLSILKEDGTIVDTIAFQDEVQEVMSGNKINVGEQLTRIEGNKLFITPHFGKLEYNTKYYIAIPKDVLTGKIGGVDFEGLSNKPAADNAWSFTTKSAPNVTSTITVDNSHSNTTSDFRTVYGALCAAKEMTGTININVAAGDYYELVHYKSSASQTIKISGPEGNNRGEGTVIRYINCNDMNGSTHTRATMYIASGNLVLKNLTVKNETVRKTKYVSTVEASNNSQAEAIHFANGHLGTTMAAYNCSFCSHQDTILTSGKNWFYNCYIEGDTDFLWGTADACLFERCDLKALRDPNSATPQAYLMVARTSNKAATKIGKGYVIKDCNVIVENGETVFFGRNAGAGDFYDQATVVDTYMGPEAE